MFYLGQKKVNVYDGATTSFHAYDDTINGSNKENISDDLKEGSGKVKQMINKINNMPHVSQHQLLISNILFLLLN